MTLQLVAGSIKHFPFKGVDRFYDVGGLLNCPPAYNNCLRLMASRIKGAFPDVNKIGVLDARGFLFGGVVLYAPLFPTPVVMVRKLGKMPNTVASGSYDVEYGHRDGVAVQKHAVAPGDKIVLIDDLVATGGTLGAGIEAVRAAGGEVVGCITLVELEAFAKRRAEVIPADVPRVALFDTEQQLLDMGCGSGGIPEGYHDDGAPFEAATK